MNKLQIECKYGKFVVPDAHDLIATRLIENKLIDPWVADHIIHYATPDSCVIDVGAYIGDLLIPVALARTDLHFVAFEVNPEIADLLDENLRLNKVSDRTTVYRKAVMDGTSPTVCFPVPDGKISGGINYAAFGVDPARKDGLIVQAVSLDSVTYEQSVSVIKIDAQGADLDVLRGSKGIIRRYKPAVLLEYENSVTAVKDGKAYTPFSRDWNEYQACIDEIGYYVAGKEWANFLLLPGRG